MSKVKILIIMSVLLAVGCGQKERMKIASKPKDIKNTTISQGEPERPEYAIKAPDFSLRTVQGDLFNLSDYKGKVVLLNFWGTWCGPCRREIPDFNKLHDKYQKDGLEIVGITITSGSPENIYSFMKDWDIEYTILTDIEDNETQRVTAYYGRAIGQPITGLPTTLIIDRDGYIVKGYIGPRNEELFYNDLKPYLSF
ncbi:MAG: TlpA disulfide reductase family protein [Fidelibacterota bacterium]|jgi:peroxiredoxin|tara:strand:- start:2023 stop:2613 length:591 start_codon:yes stop_codon:yes gene_type:complete